MARLNEPVAAAAGDIETLRRKFLRQNRDIARINSTQSLRIRSLENECARMLSENLDLRGQILRLETELQEDRTQRIADHALEIKEKMEAQLVEWGSMLASLGSEPMPKNRPPRASKKARLQPSFGRLSSPRWRRRNTEELESAALQEGRLAPLWENRSCPRETLNREEILALCSEAAEPAESNGSPDLGPPPVSRFVDEEPVKIDLPTKSPSPSRSRAVYTREDSQPAPSPSRTPEPVEMDRSETVDEDEPQEKPTAEPGAPTEPASPVNTAGRKPIELQRIPDLSPSAIAKSLKRKTRDEDERENIKVVRSERDATKLAKGSSATAAAKDGTRPMKTVSVKRDAKETTASLPSVTVSRKPLAARTTNEVIQSPKKADKPAAAAADEVVKAKAEAKRHDEPKGRTKKPKSKEEAPAAPAQAPVAVPMPEPEPAVEPVVTSIELEIEALSAEPNLSAPTSPASATPCEETRDTPPPFDISNSGETVRPSRRNRTAVSYAEPNLRDKMRRPSKQLFDAVAGEGKGIRRSSSSSKQGGDLSSVKSEEKSAQAWKNLPASASIPAEAPASPLAEKVLPRSPAAELPNSVVTDRRKRNSSIAVHGGLGGPESTAAEELTTKTGAKPTNRRLEGITMREAETRHTSDEPEDVYEFPDSSPANDAKRPAPEDGKKASSKPRQSRAKRASSAMGEEPRAEAAEPQTKNARAANSKKRASMMAPRPTRMTDSDLSRPGSPVEGDSMSSLSSTDADPPKDRAAMRRRSMML